MNRLRYSRLSYNCRLLFSHLLLLKRTYLSQYLSRFQFHLVPIQVHRQCRHIENRHLLSLVYFYSSQRSCVLFVSLSSSVSTH